MDKEVIMHKKALYEKKDQEYYQENNKDKNDKINDNKLTNDSNSLNNLNNSKKTNFIITSPENNNINKNNNFQNKFLFNQTRIDSYNAQFGNNLNYPEIPTKENNQYITQNKNSLIHVQTRSKYKLHCFLE